MRPPTKLAVTLSSVLALAAGLATGCEEESPRVKLERELVKLRTERTEKLGDLYEQYGGGTLSEHVAKDAREEAKELEAEANAAEDAPDAKDRDHDGKRLASGMLQALGNVAADMDRSGFESHCLAIGKGDRPTILTKKAKVFFHKDEVKEACREIADLALRIEDRQRKLAALPGGASSGPN